MTGAYVNHEDIRQFLAKLGKEKVGSDARPLPSLDHVAKCFGLPFTTLDSRCRADGPASPNGLPLHRGTMFALGELVSAHDMTALKNTKRLELIAEAFGWKADAFMHHLKNTTAGLGRNETMLPGYEGIRSTEITDLDTGRTMPFMLSHLRSSRNGLFLFAGPSGSGKSTTLQMTVRNIAKMPEMASPAISLVIIEPDPETMRMPVGEKLARIASALRRSPPDYLVIPEIRDAEAAEFALKMAELMVVMCTMHAMSPRSAVLTLHRRAGGFPLDALRGAYCQYLVKSAPGAKLSRTVLCDMMVVSDGEAKAVAATPLYSDHLYGIYADAVVKIANGEIEERTIRLGFGGEFQGYLDRFCSMEKITLVKEIPHSNLTKLADLKMTTEWPVETIHHDSPST